MKREETANRFLHSVMLDEGCAHTTRKQARNAVVLTLVQNCRMHGIDPCEYFKDVLERLPRASNQNVQQLTPVAWKKTRAKTQPRAA